MVEMSQNLTAKEQDIQRLRELYGLKPGDDPALIAAWRRFLDYDRVSSDQKQQSLRLRELIVYIQLATSVIAIVSTLLVINGVPQVVSDVIRLVLIALPVVSVGLMNYSAQFASSTAWIEYRVGAETIRQKIYQYRMGAGEFFGLERRKAQEKLLDVINRADQRIDEANATLPYMKPMDESDAKTAEDFIKYRIRLKTDTPFKPNAPEQPFDDGLSVLDVPTYVDRRVRKQIDWYTNRIDRDYRDMRRYRLTALIIAGLGSVFAAIGQSFEALVAITTAFGVAYNALADTRMYGATYGIFHWTASKLRIEMNKWDILTAEEKADPSIQSRFVASMENIFRREQQMWRKSAIESQQLIDRSLSANIKSGSGQEMMQRLALREGSESEIAEDSGIAHEDVRSVNMNEQMHTLITGETPTVAISTVLESTLDRVSHLPMLDDAPASDHHNDEEDDFLAQPDGFSARGGFKPVSLEANGTHDEDDLPHEGAIDALATGEFSFLPAPDDTETPKG
jgi:hypothetical protein